MAADAELDFEWDERKARSNRAKHGVSFTEAVTVFADEQALLIADPDHSLEEERFVLLGLSAALRLLVVVHVYRDDDARIRIVSARPASTTERHSHGAR